MSYQGQTWVDEVALPKLKNTGELVVMLRVANHAGNGPRKMSGCYASAGQLAKESIQGRSTTLKHLRELTKRGLLVPGDPALVDHISPDKRPSVYDLAGAHDDGCPGGHPMHHDCPTTAGVQIEHPKKKSRSAGVRSEHPHPKKGGAGVQNDAERVFKSSTKSSKELKDLSLYAGAGVVNTLPADGGQGQNAREKEPAAPQEPPPADRPGTGPAAEVEGAYLAAYETARGVQLPWARQVRADAERFLAAGWPVEHLKLLAADMPGKGYTSLARHAEHNPPRAAVIPDQRSAPPEESWPEACATHPEPEPGQTDLGRRYIPTGNNRVMKCPDCHPHSKTYQAKVKAAAGQ